MKHAKSYIRRLEVLMTEMEYDAFIQAFNNTPYRKKNEYVRKLLFGKPVTVLYRNRSLDEFIEAVAGIRKELKVVLDRDTYSQTEKEVFKTTMDHIMQELIKIIEQCSQS